MFRRVGCLIFFKLKRAARLSRREITPPGTSDLHTSTYCDNDLEYLAHHKVFPTVVESCDRYISGIWATMGYDKVRLRVVFFCIVISHRWAAKYENIILVITIINASVLNGLYPEKQCPKIGG